MKGRAVTNRLSICLFCDDLERVGNGNVMMDMIDDRKKMLY